MIYTSWQWQNQVTNSDQIAVSYKKKSGFVEQPYYYYLQFVSPYAAVSIRKPTGHEKHLPIKWTKLHVWDLSNYESLSDRLKKFTCSLVEYRKEYEKITEKSCNSYGQW